MSKNETNDKKKNVYKRHLQFKSTADIEMSKNDLYNLPILSIKTYQKTSKDV